MRKLIRAPELPAQPLNCLLCSGEFWGEGDDLYIVKATVGLHYGTGREVGLDETLRVGSLLLTADEWALQVNSWGANTVDGGRHSGWVRNGEWGH